MPARFGGSTVIHGGPVLESFSLGTSKGVTGLRDYSRNGRRIESGEEFKQAGIPVFQSETRAGRVLAEAESHALVIQGNRGRGRITALAFTPEKEPFRSWKGRGWFWAQVADVPPALFDKTPNNNYGSLQSIDGSIGAMIDSKQVRKLPVSWLLLLLAIYLVVIGPLDQWWLKKINRQMLTWITFPCYVVGFSLLIYWIGFMLRAGETEWNELHLVDVFPMGAKAELRGRTYASVYSPSNSRYPVGSEVQHATFRGEFQGSWNSSQELSRTDIMQLSKGFSAEVFVPVWTSQLFVSDWSQAAAEPISISVAREGDRLIARAENKLKHPVQKAWLVAEGRVHEFPKMAPGERQQLTLAPGSGVRLEDFVRQNAGSFGMAAQQRRNAFGDSRSNYLPDPPSHLAAASFISQMPANSDLYNYGNGGFLMPQGFDLSEPLQRGKACLLAWTAGYSAIPNLNQFDPRRVSRDTMFRVMVDLP
jgi:hypothetical protein